MKLFFFGSHHRPGTYYNAVVIFQQQQCFYGAEDEGWDGCFSLHVTGEAAFEKLYIPPPYWNNLWTFRPATAIFYKPLPWSALFPRTKKGSSQRSTSTISASPFPHLFILFKRGKHSEGIQRAFPFVTDII